MEKPESITSNIINKKEEKLKQKNIKDESPINLQDINFTEENKKDPELKKKESSQNKKGYDTSSLFYDKYSKRIIYLF